MSEISNGTLFKISPKRKFGLIRTGTKLISFSFENVAPDDKGFLEVGDTVTFVIENTGYREIAKDVCKDAEMSMLENLML